MPSKLHPELFTWSCLQPFQQTSPAEQGGQGGGPCSAAPDGAVTDGAAGDLPVKVTLGASPGVVGAVTGCSQEHREALGVNPAGADL